MKTNKETIEEFVQMFDSSLWRDEKDPTISYMAIGNVTDWLLATLEEKDKECEERVSNEARRILLELASSLTLTPTKIDKQ